MKFCSGLTGWTPFSFTEISTGGRRVRLVEDRQLLGGVLAVGRQRVLW